jgi:hypothetical protein
MQWGINQARAGDRDLFRHFVLDERKVEDRWKTMVLQVWLIKAHYPHRLRQIK